MCNYKWTYLTKFGPVTIGANATGITYLKTYDKCIGESKETDLIRSAYSQLKSYLSGKRCDFDLPLDPQGTPFQKQVWNASLEIPYGKTITYKVLAQMISKPKSVRAIGAANGKNPIYIVIPCHRIVGSNGSLTGYGGGLEMKENLLKLEGAEF